MHAYILERIADVEQHPLKLVELPDPEPLGGQVRLRVRACACCRTDLHVVEGELPQKALGVTPGHQVVGIVDKLGPGVAGDLLGQRVGVAWLHATCGVCKLCQSGRENLCELALFTGYTAQGGFAELMLARADFIYPLPRTLTDEHVAPLLCAGIIGYRALRRTDLVEFRGARLGIYGFGAAGHLAIQIARARGADVYVATREPVHQDLARELGATWVGGTFDAPPVRLDASIVFAPAGEIVPHALSHLDKGATLVLGGIHMSDIPQLPYAAIYGERTMRSVANNTREDGRAFLEEAARIGLHTEVQVYPFAQVSEALCDLKRGLRGAAVISFASD